MVIFPRNLLILNKHNGHAVAVSRIEATMNDIEITPMRTLQTRLGEVPDAGTWIGRTLASQVLAGCCSTLRR